MAQEPAVYNSGVGYPVDQVVDGNLTLVDVYSNGKYGNLTARAVTAPFGAVGLQPSGDVTGATDVASVNNLLNTFGVADLVLATGQWYGSTQVSVPVSSRLRGSGPGTVWNYSGNGSAIYQHDPIGPPGGFGSYHTIAGGVRDLTIDGTSAGANAVGLDIGDGWGYRVENVRIQNFTGASAVGLYLNNRFFWTEKGRFQCTLWGNTNQCVLNGNNGGQQSFEFNAFDFDVFAFAGQNGVSAQGGAFLNKCRLRMVGNFLAGTSSLASNFVLQFTGNVSGGSRMQRSIIEIDVELDNTNTFAPQTINFGAAANKITDCVGSLAFDPSAVPVNFLTSNAAAGQFTFGGDVVGDTQLAAVNVAVTGWLPPVSVASGNAFGSLASFIQQTVSPSHAGVGFTVQQAVDLGAGIEVTGDTTERWKLRGDGRQSWGPGNAPADTILERGAANLLQVTTTDFDVATTGRGLRVAEGSNAKQGTATLSSGSVVVANTSVTATSRIFLTAQDNSSTGTLRVSARTAGTSFTITSSVGTDSGVVAYEIFEPG